MLGKKFIEANESYGKACKNRKLYDVEYRKVAMRQDYEMAEIKARYKEEIQALSSDWEEKLSGYKDAEIFIERLKSILHIVRVVLDKKMMSHDQDVFLREPDMQWISGLSWRNNFYFHSVTDSLVFFRREDGSRFWVPTELFHSSDRDIAKWTRGKIREYKAALKLKEVRSLERKLKEAKAALAVKNEDLAKLEKQFNRLVNND